MKLLRMIPVLVLALALTAGCSGQAKPNPNSFSCPSTSGTTTYVLVNTTPVTGLSLSDTPTVGTYCYEVQSLNNTVTPTLVSNPSNTALVTLTASLPTSNVAWLAPTTGITPTGYSVYRAPATVTTLLAPTLSNPTTSLLEMPDAPELHFSTLPVVGEIGTPQEVTVTSVR